MKTLTILLAMLVAIGAGAQSKYQTFGPKTSNPNCHSFGGIQVTAINDSGQVLGWSCPGGEAFLISHGDVWTRKLVRTNGSPLFMNNAATIVGVEGPSNQAFYKVSGQQVQNLSVGNQGHGAIATGINTAGYVAGGISGYDTPRNQGQLFLVGTESFSLVAGSLSSPTRRPVGQ